jgi:urease accessory protein
MRIADLPRQTDTACWAASLRLHFAERSGRTVAIDRRHSGPLRVQRPLYPDGARTCHMAMLHPPGGIAGGDALDIDIAVDSGAHAVLTTPGATKWYKANGRASRQSVRITLTAGATLEWLPQNNIVFDDAAAQLDFTLRIAPGAGALGWDATLLGRQAAGERFARGSYRSVSRIVLDDGTPLWSERTALSGEDARRAAPHGLGGMPAFATLWAVGEGCTPELAEALCAQLPFDDRLRAGASCLVRDELPGAPRLILVRVTGTAMQDVQALLARCRETLAPAVHGGPTRALRLWAT